MRVLLVTMGRNRTLVNIAIPVLESEGLQLLLHMRIIGLFPAMRLRTMGSWGMMCNTFELDPVAGPGRFHRRMSVRVLIWCAIVRFCELLFNEVLDLIGCIVSFFLDIALAHTL